ncbi:MAG: phosphatase PAP2 family protein, partial [Verrucomicrobiia bacterium]
MDLLQSIDRALFNFGNQTLSNPVFDWLMPFLSGNRLFAPFVICAAIWLIWKYKARGVLCVLFCAIAVGIGDGWIINTLRKVVQRPRPFNDIETAITLVGRTGSFSLPSAHSANAFAISMVCLIYFRNSWKFMLPLAFGITYSRVYNGVHYPADTVMGAVMGAGYGLMFVWLARELWTWAGQKWFP